MRPLVLSLCFLCGHAALVLAQENSFDSAVDAKISKMAKAAHLADNQKDAVRPIVREYMFKRQQLLEETANQGIVDHVEVKRALRELKNTEYGKLSKILSPEQMQEWTARENLTAALNPDGGAATVDDEGASLTSEGANFKF